MFHPSPTKLHPLRNIFAAAATFAAPLSPVVVAVQTRGALSFTSDEYPGAFLKDEGIFYVTVAGAALMGEKDAPRRSRARFAYG